MKLFRIYIAVTLLNILVFTLIFVFVPQARIPLATEDMILEDLSAVLFFASFVLGVIFILRTRRENYSRITLIVPILGLMGFLDEVSFGMRLAGVEKFVFLGHEFDGLHDIVEFSYLSLERALSSVSWQGPALMGAASLVILFMMDIKSFREGRAWLKKNAVRMFFLIGLAGAGILYASFGHKLVEAMYEGRSIALLNNIIEHQETHPLSYYLHKADKALLGAAFFGIGLYAVYEILLKCCEYAGEFRDLVKRNLAIRLTLVAMGFVLVAVALDLHIFFRPILWFIEELFEMNAALALVFASLAIGSKEPVSQ